MVRQSRREVLALGAAGAVGVGSGTVTGVVRGLRGSTVDDGGADAATADDTGTTEGADAPGSPPVDVRGALYLPTRAFNAYQMWANYDPAVIERDLCYAYRLNLNAIRTWVNYEYWQTAPAEHFRRLEHLLDTAERYGIRVLVGLFEALGDDPTEENLTNADPWTATAVQSPAWDVVVNEARWDGPRQFVRWFMDHYRDDDRLLAIEAINEPGWDPQTVEFSSAMFETMVEERGAVPLTVGSTSMKNNLSYVDWGADILQFHYNFPRSRDTLRDALRQVKILAEDLPQPVWFTEWQRVRSTRGFHSTPPPSERVPNYSSMAPVIREAALPNFFWSLMLKPAHIRSQRRAGVLNGLFHEDGAVWSLDDARAIKAMSGDPAFEGRERRQWPEWLQSLKERTT